MRALKCVWHEKKKRTLEFFFGLSIPAQRLFESLAPLSLIYYPSNLQHPSSSHSSAQREKKRKITSCTYIAAFLIHLASRELKAKKKKDPKVISNKKSFLNVSFFYYCFAGDALVLLMDDVEAVHHSLKNLTCAWLMILTRNISRTSFWPRTDLEVRKNMRCAQPPNAVLTDDKACLPLPNLAWHRCALHRMVTHPSTEDD